MSDETTQEKEKFEPYEKWLKAWRPPKHYITLKQVKEMVGEEKLVDALQSCQCLGYTMHKEVEIPYTAWWTDTQWQWDVEENRCGQPQYAEYLQFQVAVYEQDVKDFLNPPVVVRESTTIPSADLEIEMVEELGEGLPDGWEIYTAGGLAWQAVTDNLHGPMRLTAARATADAWSWNAQQAWS